MQGGSLYHFYDGLWYNPAERRTHDLPCERRTRYWLSQPHTVCDCKAFNKSQRSHKNEMQREQSAIVCRMRQLRAATNESQKTLNKCETRNKTVLFIVSCFLTLVYAGPYGDRLLLASQRSSVHIGTLMLRSQWPFGGGVGMFMCFFWKKL